MLTDIRHTATKMETMGYSICASTQFYVNHERAEREGCDYAGIDLRKSRTTSRTFESYNRATGLSRDFGKKFA